MLLNNNQVGIILQANSGLPFNIRSNVDLNKDGVNNDRPVGIERNSGRLGRVANLDLRYSRFVPVRDTWRGELFFEAKNLFNVQNVVGASTGSSRPTPSACPPAALPSTFPRHVRLRPATDAARGQVLLLGRWPEVTGGSGRNPGPAS